MTTAAQLVAQGKITAIGGGLLSHELPGRCIYALPRALKWFNDVLPGLESDGFYEGAATPLEQADALFHDFVAGESLAGMLPKPVKPYPSQVWELRTHDLRFFGWFWRRGVFIMSDCDTANRCKAHGLYGGYASQAAHERDCLDLDEPKSITGGVVDVL